MAQPSQQLLSVVVGWWVNQPPPPISVQLENVHYTVYYDNPAYSYSQPTYSIEAVWWYHNGVGFIWRIALVMSFAQTVLWSLHLMWNAQMIKPGMSQQGTWSHQTQELFQ